MGNLLLFFILAFSKEGRGFQGKSALAVFLELQQILRAMILRLLCFQFTGGWAGTDVPSMASHSVAVAVLRLLIAGICGQVPVASVWISSYDVQ